MQTNNTNMRQGVTDYTASPKQKILITRLCMALGISIPVEQSCMTSGTAGKLIRQLLWEVKKKGRD